MTRPAGALAWAWALTVVDAYAVEPVSAERIEVRAPVIPNDEVAGRAAERVEARR